MRLLPAALLAALLLAGCANAAPPPRPAGTTAAGTTAAGAPAASAPFYLRGYLEGGTTATPAVEVIDGFTGQVEASIAATDGVLSRDGGRAVWGPCGAAPDDRTFLLCGASQYWELRLGDDGKPQSMTGLADIPVAARNRGNGGPQFAVSADRRLAADITGPGVLGLSLVTRATRSRMIPSWGRYPARGAWGRGPYVALGFGSQCAQPAAGGRRG